MTKSSERVSPVLDRSSSSSNGQKLATCWTKLFLQTSAQWQPSWLPWAAHSHPAVDVDDSLLSRGSKQTAEMRLVLQRQHTDTVSLYLSLRPKSKILLWDQKFGLWHWILVRDQSLKPNLLLRPKFGLRPNPNHFSFHLSKCHEWRRSSVAGGISNNCHRPKARK